MGAVAVLPLARARLRDLGATSVPRGRMSSTRSNPGGLTDRQLEVLQLMVAGLTNSEIARRLVLSPKTVEHHVGAVLGQAGRDQPCRGGGGREAARGGRSRDLRVPAA